MCQRYSQTRQDMLCPFFSRWLSSSTPRLRGDPYRHPTGRHSTTPISPCITVLYCISMTLLGHPHYLLSEQSNLMMQMRAQPPKWDPLYVNKQTVLHIYHAALYFVSIILLFIFAITILMYVTDFFFLFTLLMSRLWPQLIWRGCKQLS